MVKSKVTIIWLITTGTFFAFFVFGFTDNLKGGTLPALLQEFKFTYSQGGTVLFGAYVGFLLATLLTGVLADLAGKKTVILVAGLCLILGILGYTASTSYLILFASMLVLGLGLGSIEVGANAIIVDLYQEQKGRYLNLMSVFYGMGSMLAPLFAGTLLAAGLSWRRAYQGDLILAAALLLAFLLLRMPRSTNSKEEKIDLSNLRRIAFTSQLIGIFLAISLYVATEIGIASWIVEFLEKTRYEFVATSTGALSFFFAAIMLGRLAGSFLVERIGYFRSLLIASSCAAACIALGVFGPQEFSFFLPISGLFLSIIFPTLTAVVSDLHEENIGTVLGFLFTFGGLGGMLGPWLVGVLSDRLGIQYGFGVNLVFGLLMTIFLFVLMTSIRLPVKTQSEH